MVSTKKRTASGERPTRRGPVEFEAIAPQEIVFGDPESYWSESVDWLDVCSQLRMKRAVRLPVPADEVAVVKWCALQAAIEEEQQNPSFHYDGEYLFIWSYGDPSEPVEEAQRKGAEESAHRDAERAELLAKFPVTLSRETFDRLQAGIERLTERVKSGRPAKPTKRAGSVNRS